MDELTLKKWKYFSSIQGMQMGILLNFVHEATPKELKLLKDKSKSTTHYVIDKEHPANVAKFIMNFNDFSIHIFDEIINNEDIELKSL